MSWSNLTKDDLPVKDALKLGPFDLINPKNSVKDEYSVKVASLIGVSA